MSPALRPAVFVDKDGTLVENVPYNVNPELLRFEPDALLALSALSAAGYAIVIATNQSGLARGYFSLREFELLRHALVRRLSDEAGVAVAGVYFCPHGPNEEGDPVCACRKPMPGLLRQAAQEHGLDLHRSWMVGDTLDDIEAGRRAGCRTILYDSGGETVWKSGPQRSPHAHVHGWSGVVQAILSGANDRRGTGDTTPRSARAAQPVAEPSLRTP